MLTTQNLYELLSAIHELQKLSYEADLPAEFQYALAGAFELLNNHIDKRTEPYCMPVYLAMSKEDILANKKLDVQPVNDWV